MGVDCARANLQPWRDGEAYANTTAASWGGRPLYAEGKWHLFATQIAKRCPLILFMNNSEVMRAEADSPAGPFTFKQVILPPFHHNPTAIGPTPDGYYLIFSIGTNNPDEWLLQCESSLPACATKDKCRSHGTPDTNGQISISWSKTMQGPWQTRVALAPFQKPAGAWNCKNNNPSAIIEEDGSVLLMYHGSSCDKSLKGERLGLAEAKHWNDTFVKRAGGPIIAPENGTGSHEDPFMWRDRRGNFHALTHDQSDGNRCGSRSMGSTCGAHLYSRDSFEWHISKNPVYTNSVVLANGTTKLLKTRQRPQLVFSNDSDKRPLILYNGASFEGDNGDLQMLTHTLAFRFAE
jgi:hypothetical protein